jgi:hypothetical protein
MVVGKRAGRSGVDDEVRDPLREARHESDFLASASFLLESIVAGETRIAFFGQKNSALLVDPEPWQYYNNCYY